MPKKGLPKAQSSSHAASVVLHWITDPKPRMKTSWRRRWGCFDWVPTSDVSDMFRRRVQLCDDLSISFQEV